MTGWGGGPFVAAAPSRHCEAAVPSLRFRSLALSIPWSCSIDSKALLLSICCSGLAMRPLSCCDCAVFALRLHCCRDAFSPYWFCETTVFARRIVRRRSRFGIRLHGGRPAVVCPWRVEVPARPGPCRGGGPLAAKCQNMQLFGVSLRRTNYF
ncbi:hypothetical protein HMPREF9136_1666 [Prevotella dentalis DSM 3688]|uniref:Uncharacterized protein n=1 Tax=Prevotella dentalis (strain ATCC 49559 / DSM 3688 / JCM 13448 / NCTC 12043 / ES 2772) TaxID=908937 RepID=F9D488_PREDD|nr:hypothetical protein HMPREF9136_1666 [Prevotella dentalis DSM 3688]